jgi:hypothetical protein
MAMHVHSSFSEQSGSMEAQLFQTQSNHVDVMWWTDHDFRMEARNYKHAVHFTSLTNETGDGRPWQWQKRTSGALASSSGGISSVGSPNDPIAGSSLKVSARSASGTAGFGYYAETRPAGWDERCSLYGQTLTLDVLPTSVGPDGYLEVLISTSYHLARGGRPKGKYSLSYRFGGHGTPGSRVANGLQGIVTVPYVAGQWKTAALTPCTDIAALWPDMDERDFALYGITLSSVSTGGVASGNFDYLRFTRAHTSGEVPLQMQRDIMSGYASAFPGVTQHQGLEMSPFYPHVNWFGGAVSLPNYGTVNSTAKYLAFMAQQVKSVHAAGGLASYNHPYGASTGGLLSGSAQDSTLSSTATTMLNDKALGCDIIEVGYPNRGGMDLGHHVGLWDVLSRNGRFLTGNGVNDDHMGQGWLGLTNNWVTAAWASSTSEAALLTALASGRCWTYSLRYPVTLDLRVDGTCPMGSASISTQNSRQVQVFATGVPAGGSVAVLRGKVDYAGTASPVPNVKQIGSGTGSFTVDTSSSCFVRTAVKTSTGAVVAVSNPVWLLRAAPAGGIPSARAC